MPSSYFNVTVSSTNQAAYETSGGGSETVFWEGALNTSATPDVLYLELDNNIPPFGDPITAMNSIDLSTAGSSSGCGACVLVFTKAQFTNGMVKGTASTQVFLATSGTLHLTAVPTVPATGSSRVTGSLSNLTLEHASIDSTTGAVTALNDGCFTTLTSLSFDSLVTNM